MTRECEAFNYTSRPAKRSIPGISRTLLAAVAVVAALYTPMVGAAAMARGGSNYHWYDIVNCDREPYGVLKNYHMNVATIRSQLGQMHSTGQDRLSLGIFFGRGLSTGTVIDSTGGNIAQQYRDNLANLIADARAAGFTEILFRFFPQGQNDPTQWTSYSEDLFQENWNLIFNLRPILVASGMQYKIDLGVEEAPPDAGSASVPKNPAWSQYVQKLWTNYFYMYGKNDTIGFSFAVIAGDIENRIRHMSYVYGSEYPYLFGLDFYGNSTTGASESQLFQLANAYMNQYGAGGQGWIVAEAYYNDATAASQISSAMTSTGRTVFYLTQWPIERVPATCNVPDVTVSPPTSYGNYSSYGF